MGAAGLSRVAVTGAPTLCTVPLLSTHPSKLLHPSACVACGVLCGALCPWVRPSGLPSVRPLAGPQVPIPVPGVVCVWSPLSLQVGITTVDEGDGILSYVLRSAASLFARMLRAVALRSLVPAMPRGL